MFVQWNKLTSDRHPTGKNRRIERALRWDFSQCRLTIHLRCCMDRRRQSLLTWPSVRIRMHFYSLSHFPHFAKLAIALSSGPPAALGAAADRSDSAGEKPFLHSNCISSIHLFLQLAHSLTNSSSSLTRWKMEGLEEVTLLKGSQTWLRLVFSSKMFLWSGRRIWDTLM